MQFDAQLPEGWRWETIESVQSAVARPVVTGPFGSSIGSKFFVDAGVPVIRGSNLSLSRTKFIDEGFVFLTEEKAAEFKNLEARPGDLVFTAAGTIGQVGIIPARPRFPRYIISNKQMRARLDTSIVEPLFAYYWFSEPYVQEYIRSRNTGSTIPLINLSVLKSLPIPVPPIDTQHGILGVIATLDDRIDLLRQTNATLESIAQALFKSWFIDFDPVRAKAEGREPEGMDAATAALFPAEFEESALGLIPRGWEPTSVGKIFRIIMGQSPPGETYNQEGIGVPFYQGRTDFGFRFPSVRVHCTAPTRLARAGDVLVSVRAPVGDVNVALEPCAVGRGVAAINLDGAHSFALYSMKSLRERFNEYESHGTVFGSINKKQFEALPCIRPPSSIISTFDHATGPLDDLVRTNEQQIRTLTELRDTLLPRLISGKLRLPEAAREIEEALA